MIKSGISLGFALYFKRSLVKASYRVLKDPQKIAK